MTNEEVILQFELEAPDDFTIYSFVLQKMLNKAEVIEEMKNQHEVGTDFIGLFRVGFEGQPKHYKPKS